MTSAIERYSRIEDAYRTGPSTDASLHAQLAILDFQLRFAMLCLAASLRQLNPDGVGLPRAPGFGAYLAFLRRAKRLLSAAPQTPERRRGITLADTIMTAVQAGNGQDTQFGNIVNLRNHVCHGGAVPAGAEGLRLAGSVQAASARASAAIHTFLNDAQSFAMSEEKNFYQVEVRWADGALNLWPFICSDGSKAWCVFASFTKDLPVFIGAGQRKVRIEGQGERLCTDLSRSLVPRADETACLEYLDDLLSDLEGFRDKDFQPTHHEDQGIIHIIWARLTGAGVEERSDRFRLGPGDLRQWESEPGTWQTYPSFLRFLANWPVVAKGFRQHFQDIEQQLLDAENTALGWRQDSTHLIEPNVRVTDLQERNVEWMPFSALREQIDNRLEARGSRTQIFFVTGEAGIGKTRTLLSAALRRAESVEAETASDPSEHRSPLYLYVRSTGQAASSLQTAVAAAVSGTRNLTEQSVRALCRNGLLALFIDGFDELLGGVGYENALGSLQTWIEAMEGRGVLVVSARSSYYLNQYRSSLMNNRQNAGLAVEHRVAWVERWDEQQVTEFLNRHGLGGESLDILSADDRALLGLPFFSRVYVESKAAPEHVDGSLPDLILNQYLEREAGKLVMGDEHKPLMSRVELQNAFETMATIMAEKDERELDLDDLQFSVDVALPDGIESRRGLTNRLSVLCGLQVATHSEVQHLFSFQHELFYDLFLANAICHDLRSEGFARLTNSLQRTQWRTATVDRVVKAEPAAVHQLLSSISIRAVDLHDKLRTPFSSNLGALWTMLATHAKSLAGASIKDARFEELDLRNVRVDDTHFLDCEIARLWMPTQTPWSMAMESCRIGELRVKSHGQALAGLKRFDEIKVEQLITTEALVERPGDVLQTLRQFGAPLPSTGTTSPVSEFAEASRFYLNRIQWRADAVYIEERGFKTPEGDGNSWQQEYGEETWEDFIRILRDSDAATLVKVSAAGPPLLRVKFQCQIKDLLSRAEEDPAVTKFWRLVNGRVR